MSERTSLYRHFDANGQLLYVGIAYDVMSRLRQHGKADACWFWDVATIKVEHFDTRNDAIHAEATAIAKEKPQHNAKFPIPSAKYCEAKNSERPLAKMHSMVLRMPIDMRAEIEEIAGPNRMAEFIREAVAEKIERAKATKPPED